MATFKNESEETFVFPSLGLTVEPGDSFDADVEITTSGIALVSASKKKLVEADPIPVAPAETAVAPETPAEEGK